MYRRIKLKGHENYEKIRERSKKFAYGKVKLAVFT